MRTLQAVQLFVNAWVLVNRSVCVGVHLGSDSSGNSDVLREDLVLFGLQGAFHFLKVSVDCLPSYAAS